MLSPATKLNWYHVVKTPGAPRWRRVCAWCRSPNGKFSVIHGVKSVPLVNLQDFTEGRRGQA